MGTDVSFAGVKAAGKRNDFEGQFPHIPLGYAQGQTYVFFLYFYLHLNLTTKEPGGTLCDHISHL